MASPPDPYRFAPPLLLRWGDLADVWAALILTPTNTSDDVVRIIVEAFADATYGDPSHPITLGDIMGMYDREPNFEDDFKRGDRFVLMGLQYAGTISTRVGPAEKVLVSLITRDSYPETLVYSALGVGFAAMAQKAEPSDFPHVAEFVRVRLPSGNEVKRFARVNVSPADWRNGDDGPPLDPSALDESGNAAAPADAPRPTNPGF